MKYVVKLTYTNPAHEHVTLRRRVDTVNRIVEAASEQEALNRAANQQRALGFKIQEATIVEQEKAPVKTEQLTEASKEGSAVMRGMRATLKSMDLRHGVDSDKREAGYKMSPAVKAAQAKSDVLSKVVKSPQAGTLAAAKLRKEEVEYIEEKLTAADPASKWISDFVKSDNPKFAGKSKKERINQALGAYYAAKRGNVEEGYDPSSAEIAKMLVKKHGAGNVTKQHILDMEADRDSRKALDHDEIMKHVKKMTEEVEQLSEGPSHYQYSGTIHSNVVNAKHGEEKDDGHSYSITIPTRGVHQGDLGSFLSSKKAFSRISRENPHLEPHHVLAIMHGTGDYVEDVEVDHKDKTYKHRLYNTQEPDYLYEESKNLRFDPEAPLRMSASIVKMWKKSKTGDKKAAAAWAKHVRRIQKVEPEGMSKKDIEDHMQSHFGESVEIAEAAAQTDDLVPRSMLPDQSVIRPGAGFGDDIKREKIKQKITKAIEKKRNVLPTDNPSENELVPQSMLPDVPGYPPGYIVPEPVPTAPVAKESKPTMKEETVNPYVNAASRFLTRTSSRLVYGEKND